MAYFAGGGDDTYDHTHQNWHCTSAPAPPSSNCGSRSLPGQLRLCCVETKGSRGKKAIGSPRLGVIIDESLSENPFKSVTVMHSCDKSRVRHKPHTCQKWEAVELGGAWPGDACPGTQAPTAVLLQLVAATASRVCFLRQSPRRVAHICGSCCVVGTNC